jgi:tetraacyldisaccharide 4'-kinase
MIHPFPEGYLRESRDGASRADAVIVTKCPTSITEEQKRGIVSEISRYNRLGTPVYFASVRYSRALSYVSKEEVEVRQVVGVAGIAQPGPFFEYIRNMYELQDEVVFPDHYNFMEADLQNILKYVKSGTFVVTTEKDMVKLKPLTDRANVSDRFLYLPIEVDLGSDAVKLKNLLDEQFKSWQKAVKKG